MDVLDILLRFIVIFCAVVLCFCWLWTVSTSNSVISFSSPKDHRLWNHVLLEFQRTDRNWYPYSDKLKFSIDHGTCFMDWPSTFSFRTRVATVCLQEKMVGMGCGSLRFLSQKDDPKKKINAWYIWGLRILQKERRKGWAKEMLRGNFFSGFLECPRAFGITMHGDGHEKVNSLARQKNFNVTEILDIFDLSFAELERINEVLMRNRGHFEFVKSPKQLVFATTEQKPVEMEILHVVFTEFSIRPSSEETEEPKPEARYMFCIPESDTKFLAELYLLDITASSHASIYAYNMPDAAIDWRCIQSCEI